MIDSKELTHQLAASGHQESTEENPEFGKSPLPGLRPGSILGREENKREGAGRSPSLIKSSSLTRGAVKPITVIPRLATAGEGPGGVVADSCLMTSVFRTFINICRGQGRVQRSKERKEGRKTMTPSQTAV